MTVSSDPAVDQILRWRRDPVQFVRDNFNVEPDYWQAEALIAFADQNVAKYRISLQACAGPGKSAVLAWCAWWFLALMGDKGEHPKGAAVSVTKQNLEDNLWSELSKWQQRSPFLLKAFTHQAERVFNKRHKETWFLSARSWSKKANAEQQGRTLSGLHSKYVLIIIDESGEIPVAVVKAGEQALSNCAFGRIIQAGNPTSRDGILYAASSILRHLWKIIRITGDPDNPHRSTRIDIDWAREQIATYGRDNPWVMSMILGEFPPASINAILGPEEVEAALSRVIRPEDYDWAQKRLGIDVARFGDDRTVLFPRQGLCAFRPIILRHQRTTDIALRAIKANKDWGVEQMIVDDSGHWGHGVIDNLFAFGLNPLPFIGEAKPINPRYFNRRTEVWLEMAAWIRRGGCLPKVMELVRECSAPTYTFANGVFVLEPKPLIKKRLGFSPDLGDALAYTFGADEIDAPAMALERAGLPGRGQHADSDWDPMANT